MTTPWLKGDCQRVEFWELMFPGGNERVSDPCWKFLVQGSMLWKPPSVMERPV